VRDLAIGHLVFIHGLATRNDLNNKTGTLIRFHSDAQRWQLQVSGSQEMIRIREINVCRDRIEIIPMQDCSHVCTTGIASADEQDIDGLLELIPEPYCTPVVKKKTLTTRVDAKTRLFDYPRLPQDAQDESSSFTEPPYTFLILQDSSGLPLSRVDQCERDMYTAMEKKLVRCVKDALTSGHIALDMRNKTNLEMDHIIWSMVMNSIELRKFLLDIPSLYAKVTHTYL
jgi:hypothetical protein